MGVILSIWPWRAFTFVDEDGVSVLDRWIERERIDISDRQVLFSRLILLEQFGPDSLPGCILPLQDEFYYLNVKARKQSLVMTPVLCYGPFGESEITILAGAPIENGMLGAINVLPIARNNLEILKADKRRRVLHEKQRR
jgi:hypothetical protein